MPATDPYCPFPEHAPSVYTTSSASTDKDEAVTLGGSAAARDLSFEGPEAGRNLESDWMVGVGLIVDGEEDTRTCSLDCDQMTALA